MAMAAVAAVPRLSSTPGMPLITAALPLASCLPLPYAAIRQALSKAIVAFFQKYIDEQAKVQIKEALLQYDRTLLVADPRRCEPKKWVRGRGGPWEERAGRAEILGC